MGFCVLKLSLLKIYHKFVNGVLETERTTVHISDDKAKIATVDKKTVDQSSLIENPTAVVRYQLDNHLGSASLELDESANIISYEEYHPFGTTSYRSGRSETETSQKRYKYVGKERDEETGLYYYGFRYYAAWICRFVSVDPLQFEYPQLTPFNYAGNKPVTHIDIDGLQSSGDEKRTLVNYTISGGDTFWGLEERLGINHGDLQKLNPGLDPYNLQIGTKIRTTPEVLSDEIKGISGLDIGLVNFDFTAYSKTGKYTIHPIIGGANAGNWLVREHFENGMYENVVIGGHNTFSDLCYENFNLPLELNIETPVAYETPRTLREIYLDLTNEEEAMTNYFENPSWSTFKEFAYKRALNQFSNPMNYLRLKAGSPQIFKYKGSLNNFNAYRSANPIPKNINFRGQGRGSASRYYKKTYRMHKERVKIYYDNRVGTAVSNIKTIQEISKQKDNE